jgi:uncharacterized membrane protein
LRHIIRLDTSLMGALSGVLVVLHVISSVVGFGAVAATGACAWVASRDAGAPAVARYFRPGPNWASYSVLLVPVFGAALEASKGWPDLGRAWPWLALGIWAMAAAAGLGAHWPSERRIQALVAAVRKGGGPGPAGAAAAGDGLAGACRRAMWSSGVMTVAFGAALAVMVVQPK